MSSGASFPRSSSPFPRSVPGRGASASAAKARARRASRKICAAFEGADLSMDGYAVFRTPGGRQQTVPTCLGRTERFEDWQVTFELKYKQIIR